MQENTKNVWLDCDPGLDDTLAIIMAASTSQINLLGLSTSAGNTTIENTTKNSLDILFNIGRQDVMVVRGSDKLVEGQPHLAEHMHGSGGLGGVVLPPSPKKAVTENSFRTIRDHIMNCSGKVTWANTGALTNLCFLLREFPEVKSKFDAIVIMGGAIGRGNITPAAEFNIFFDPVAFKQVLKTKQNVPLVMIPLQVTHQVQAMDTMFTFLQCRKKTPILNAIHQMLKSYKRMYKESSQHFDHPPIHDPTVINYILNPTHFQTRDVIIEVDVEKCSYGRTNCYFIDSVNRKDHTTIDVVAVKMNQKELFWAMFERIFQNLAIKGNIPN